MTSLITARGLTKKYGRFRAVDEVDFEIRPGRIIGLVGPNGAGKSTVLKTILGLVRFQGDLRVLGRDPRSERAELMREVSYIADIASLPDWIRVDQLLEHLEATHPAFDRDKALNFLARTEIPRRKKVRQLSKGMKTQLHLALVMGIDARLLILDEPTLGLDIIYRREFYAQLLNEYFDEQRTILVTTHQIEEIEHILSDVMFIDAGRIVLDTPIDDIAHRFVQLRVGREHANEARELGPIYETDQLDQAIMIFDDPDRAALGRFGTLSTPHLADLFVAYIKGTHHA